MDVSVLKRSKATIGKTSLAIRELGFSNSKQIFSRKNRICFDLTRRWRNAGIRVSLKASHSESGVIEGETNMERRLKPIMSWPWVVVYTDLQCDSEDPGSSDSGCNGGLMTSACGYTLKAGGLMLEVDYPYTGTNRSTCKFDDTKIAASVANFSIVSLEEDQIAADLVKNGPLAVGINAVFMQTYMGGVSCPYISSRGLDHGMLLVGYGAEGYAPIRLKNKPFWIIKNSWGGSWGDNRYYKICRGHNVCGVDSMVSTVAAIHTSTR